MGSENYDLTRVHFGGLHSSVQQTPVHNFYRLLNRLDRYLADLVHKHTELLVFAHF